MTSSMSLLDVSDPLVLSASAEVLNSSMTSVSAPLAQTRVTSYSSASQPTSQLETAIARLRHKEGYNRLLTLTLILTLTIILSWTRTAIPTQTETEPHYGRPSIWQAVTIIYQQYCCKAATAGICSYSEAKICIFAPQGQVIAPIQVKFRMAEQNVGPLNRANFHQSVHGWGYKAPKSWKFTLFCKDSPCRGEPFDRFLQMLGAFMCSTTLQKCFEFDVIHFTGYSVIAEKPCIGHLPRVFPCNL